MKYTILIALAGLLLTPGCSGTGPGPLHLAMSLDRAAVAMDDSVLVTLTIVNNSAGTVMVYPPEAYGPCRLRGIEIYDSEWRPVFEGFACLASSVVLPLPQPVPLQPGSAIEIRRTWRPRETYSENGRIGPGRYRIRGVPASADGRDIGTVIREVIVGG